MKRLLLFFLLCTTFVDAQNWTTYSTQQTDLINEISVVNNDVIWLMDQQGAPNGFSISTDGGQSWTHKNFPALFTENNFNLGVLSAVDANTAYVIVSLADDANLVGVYKTTDAGTTWLREPTIFNGGASFPNQVHFWSADQGFAMGDGLELYVYYFGAWYNQSSGLNSVGTWSLNSSNYLKIVGNSAYFLTGAGTIIKTADQGINWAEIVTPFNSQSNVNFSFKDDLNGIVVFNDNTSNLLYSTTDGGQTWNFVGNNIPNLNHIIEYVPSENRYYSMARGGNSYPLSYSEDNGATWAVEAGFDGLLLGEIESTSNGKIVMGGTSNVYIKTLDFSNHPDFDALVALYNSMNGDSWINNANWLDNTVPLSGWHGVSIENNRVTQLVLNSNGLSGTIPTEIGGLSELTYLSLCCNQLTGALPSELGNLTKLTYLDLSPNRFSGSIPPEIGNLVNLETLWLNQNGLSGTIPASFQNLTKLKTLYLKGATGGDEYLSSKYSGDFPDLTALPLETLDISHNYFRFVDLADELETYKNNINYFVYSPQLTFDEPIETNIAVGGSITLTLTDVPTSSKGMQSKTALADNTYQWFKDNVAITENGNSDTYVINNAQTSDSGIYHCEITNAETPDFVIRRESITLNVGTLGTEEPQAEQLLIYPNPATSILNIKLKSNAISEVEILDLNGKQIYKQVLTTQLGIINLESLNAGVYLLQVKTNGKTIKKRIVKE